MATIALLALGPTGHPSEGPPRAHALTGGVLAQSNSRAGSAILRVNNIAPGRSASGTVKITNTGDLAGNFQLAKSKLTDIAGPGGGALSGALALRVEDLSAGKDVYQGTLGAMPTRQLGTFAPGEAHTFRFTVGLPDQGAQDNLYAGATTTVQYDWVARAAATPAPSRPVTPKRPATPKRGRPRVRVRVPKRQRILRHRGIYIRVRCDKPCRVVLRVRLKGSGHTARRAWRARRSLPGGRFVRLKVRIPARDLRMLRVLLRRSPSLRIIVGARARDRSGSSRTSVSSATR